MQEPIKKGERVLGVSGCDRELDVVDVIAPLILLIIFMLTGFASLTVFRSRNAVTTGLLNVLIAA